MEEDNKKVRILLVEDDMNLSLVLKDYLEMIDYEAVVCEDGEEGLEAFKSQEFDLCILDVMLPKKDGFALAKDIIKLNNRVPIIFLTAKSMKEDRITGFRIGCDDYITKPFSTEELSLRIKAILKRIQETAPPVSFQTDDNELFNIGNYTFDYSNQILKNEKEQRVLTRKEAELLRILCMNKNNVVQRDYALRMVWGESNYFLGRSMDVYITKLRKYLGTDKSISITNIHGTGFKLVDSV